MAQKQQLWIINFSLVVFGSILLVMLMMLAGEYRAILERPLPKPPTKIVPLEIDESQFSAIYEKDLFGTYRPPLAPVEEKPTIAQVPTLPPPEIAPPPRPAPVQFIDPIKVTLRGIIFAGNPQQSMALIEDETAKEKTYIVGEKIKDAQLIKIMRDHVVLIRANGQHETLFLHPPLEKERQPTNWQHIAVQQDGHSYELDIEQLKKEVTSLGQLLETLNLATAYVQNKPVGLRISSLPAQSVGEALGFKKGDILTSVDDIPLIPLDERTRAFERLGNLEHNQELTIHIIRDRIPSTLHYRLQPLAQKAAFPLGQPPTGTIAADLAKRSPVQQRMFEQQQFEQQHGGEREAILEEIRRRLLENMKERQRDVRMQ